MKFLKKAATLFAIAAMSTGAIANANEQCEADTQIEYRDVMGTQGMSPVVGISIVALAGVIAVAVNNNDKGEGGDFSTTVTAAVAATTHAHVH